MWFNKFKKFYNPPGTGLIPDPRPVKEKEKDYQVEEVLKTEVIKWEEKKPNQWRKFPIFNQNGSGSCAAHTIAKLLGIENVVEEGKFVFKSARDIYTRRMNYGSPGMYLQDCLRIGVQYGATFEQLMPSQGLNEEQMNKFDDRKTIDEQVALVGKAGNYVQSGVIDFDMMATVIKTGKGIILTATFNPGDWQTGEVICRKGGSYGHAVAGVDYCLWKGEKAIVFDNSWGPSWGFQGQGVIRESQKDGLLYWGYFLGLKNTWRDEIKERPKPSYRWKKDLIYGMINYDVGMLQEALQYLEMFPVNVPSTGYYGPITQRGVLSFIKEYFPSQLGLWDGKKVNGAIRDKLNEIFK